MANIPTQIQTVHALPPERPPHKNSNQYHTKYNGTRRNDRCPSYFHQFLETKFQSQSETTKISHQSPTMYGYWPHQ